MLIEKLLAEGLDTRGVPEIDAVDFDPITPLREALLGRIPLGRIDRKPGQHDHVCPRPQEHDCGLEADLHAGARHQRDPATQVRRRASLGVVQLGALSAELIVEPMHLAIRRAAAVADPLLAEGSDGLGS